MKKILIGLLLAILLSSFECDPCTPPEHEGIFKLHSCCDEKAQKDE